MLGRWTKVICLVFLAVLGAGSAQAARLAYVLGTIIAPEGVNVGDELAPGTVVKTGNDALVIVEHRWPSDVDSRDCLQVTMFGYGWSYTVSESRTPGSCQTTVSSDPTSLEAGKPFLRQGTRYSGAKFDESGVPDKVVQSDARWEAFDRWANNSQRSFTGFVTEVSGSAIRLRSPSSGKQMTFSVDPSTVDSPMQLDKLLNKSARVDYWISGNKPLQVERIRLTAPSAEPRAIVGTPTPPVAVSPPPRPSRVVRGYVAVISSSPVQFLDDLGAGATLCGTGGTVDALRSLQTLAKYKLVPLPANELFQGLTTSACKAVIVTRIEDANALRVPVGWSVRFIELYD